MSFFVKHRLNLPFFLAVLGGFFFVVAGTSRAASDNFNLRSEDYPVIVVSADPEYGGLVLELMNKSFKQFAAVTGIDSFGPIRFRVILDKDRPTESRPEMESESYPRTARMEDSPEFEIRISSSEFNPMTVVRTAMICQLEAYALKNNEGGLGDQLPVAPFWLSEGLTQGLLDKKTPSLEKIIGRIDRSGPVPSLQTVQGWQETSPHRLEQWWQEACCYWLVKKTTATKTDREALCAWIPLWFTPRARPYWDDNAESEVWWKKTLAERSPVKDGMNVGETQTREALKSCLLFKARLKGETVSRDFDLGNLPKPPLEFASAKPFDEVMARLLQLQGRGNFLWQDVIESYRFAYTMWLKGKYADYQKEVAKAGAKAENVAAYMSKTHDLLDWYEINHPSSGPKFSTLLSQSLAFQDAEALKEMDQQGIDSRLTVIEKGK